MARDLAIDLGTSSTQVYVRGQGLVLDEPSVVALDGRSQTVLAIGREATELIGRTTRPIRAVHPIFQGAVADFEITSRMLRYLLRRVGGSRFQRPKVVLSVPASATPIERRALLKAASEAGASSVRLLEAPMAAAMELGLPFGDPVGTMVCDLGGGKSEIAVLSLGGIVALRALRIGGGDLDDAIASSIRNHYGVVISSETAAAVKVAMGSVAPFAGERALEINGRAVATGEPRAVTITPEEVRLAVEDVVSQILAVTVQCLAESPPELSQDIIFHGIHLHGGGAQLRGLDQRLREATEVPVHLHEHPAQVVIGGTGRCMGALDRYDQLFSRAGS